MIYYDTTHNFGTGEHFGFGVISSKVSQIELQSSRKGDKVLTQNPDSNIPPICKQPLNNIFSGIVLESTFLASQHFPRSKMFSGSNCSEHHYIQDSVCVAV